MYKKKLNGAKSAQQTTYKYLYISSTPYCKVVLCSSAMTAQLYIGYIGFVGYMGWRFSTPP